MNFDLQIKLPDVMINGRVGFDNLEQVSRCIDQHIVEQDKIVLNLSGLVQFDSAILALFTHCIRKAGANNCDLGLTHVPKNLLGIAELNGLLQYLPVKN